MNGHFNYEVTFFVFYDSDVKNFAHYDDGLSKNYLLAPEAFYEIKNGKAAA